MTSDVGSGWALEGELRGHTPSETIAYLDWVSDYEDQQVRRCALPVGVILADCEPKLVTRLRRLFGRE